MCRNPRLPFGCVRERRIRSGALEAQPVFPSLCLIWPLLHLNTPEGGLRIKKRLLALIESEAAMDDLLGIIYEFLCSREYAPDACRLVEGRSDYAPAIGAEGDAMHHICMAIENNDHLPCQSVPDAGCLIIGCSDYPMTIRTKFSACQMVCVPGKDGRC